ncbi:MAG: adenine nucleotide alpha hydrolase family protein [Desulfarculaceae bacterium]|nr:adenine nucleotide alpha hydrolase family protein [Desulfarculaceae bacterium]
MNTEGMKCSRCKKPARHRLPSHNARFCDHCLGVFFRRQVEKAIKQFDMLEFGQRVLVAVSGGKDSLALWQVLIELGYPAEGVHVALELGDGKFGEASLASCQEMAQRLGAPLHVFNMAKLAGFTVQEIAWANKRSFCSVCGTLKRYHLNRLALELDCDVIATGHHLDDEAARLLGNLVRRHEHYLENQWPTLPGVPGAFAKKVKPLCRLHAAEVKSYAKAHDLPVARGDCPRSKGATLPYYTEAVRLLEDRMPGTCMNFYMGYLEQKDGPPAAPKDFQRCPTCGTPTFAETCTVCRFLERTAEREERKARAAQEPG